MQKLFNERKNNMIIQTGQNKLCHIQRLAELLVYLYALECVFGASGRMFSIGGVSIRMILFTLAFVATAPFVIQKRKELLRNPSVIITLIFGAAVVVSAIIGIFNNNRIGFIWADISGFLAFALLPGMFAVIDNGKKVNKLLNVIYYASFAVAVVTAVFHFGLAWMDDATINHINKWINERSLGGFALLATHIYRVYFRSQIFLQFSLLIGVWKLWGTKSKKRRFVLALCEGVMMFALIISYTRGFWVGVAAAAAAALFLEWKNWKKLVRTALMVLVVFVAFTGVSTMCYRQPYVFVEIVNRFSPNLIVLGPEIEDGPGGFTEDDTSDETDTEDDFDIIDEANENAVNMRKETLKALNKKIAEHPIVGSGLGTNLDGVRKDGKTEYMYLDILMKMGLAGLLVFLITYFMMPAVHVIRRLKCFSKTLQWQDNRVRNSFIVAGYFGVAVTSAFNPFLTSPMGVFMLITASLCVLQEESIFKRD